MKNLNSFLSGQNFFRNFVILTLSAYLAVIIFTLTIKEVSKVADDTIEILLKTIEDSEKKLDPW